MVLLAQLPIFTVWAYVFGGMIRAREGGEAMPALFLHCRNCDSLAVVSVVHLDNHLTGRHLTPIGRADNCCRCSFCLL